MIVLDEDQLKQIVLDLSNYGPRAYQVVQIEKLSDLIILLVSRCDLSTIFRCEDLSAIICQTTSAGRV